MAPSAVSSSEIREEEEKEEIRKILYDGQFYDVTQFIARHPGGSIIKFYTESGEDATAAIQQFHYRSRTKVMATMKQLRVIGPASLRNNNYGEDNKMSQYTMDRNDRLNADFNRLHVELEAEGFFEPSWTHLTYRILDIFFLGILGFYLIDMAATRPTIDIKFLVMKTVGIFMLSLSFGRCGFIGHEVCHKSMSGSKKVDGIIGNFSYGLGLGLSPSWWSSQHSRHHAMPQRLHRDVDLMTLPLLAFNSKVLEADGKRNYGGASPNGNFFIRNQSILFLTIDTFLVVLLWKFWLNPRYALKKRRWWELIFMTGHHLTQYFLYSVYGIWPYFFGFWMSAAYMFGNFSLSHSHMPVTEGPLHWVEYSLLHTQDVQSTWFPWLCDWWMGYLSCQVEHHLFPTMPHFRTPGVRERVKKLAKKYHIPYTTTGYWEAVVKTFKNLEQVSAHLKT